MIKYSRKNKLENQFDNFNNIYFCNSLENIHVKKLTYVFQL